MCLNIFYTSGSPLVMALLPENDGIKAFGMNVRKIRKAKNLSMQSVANIAEIELSQVSRIETGKINAKLSTLLILARALEVSPKDFFVD